MKDNKNLENRAKKVRQTIGHGLLGLGGLGGCAAMALYGFRDYFFPIADAATKAGYSETAMITLFTGALIATPLFATGVTSSAIAVRNLVEMGRGNYNYSPIELDEYFRD